MCLQIGWIGRAQMDTFALSSTAQSFLAYWCEQAAETAKFTDSR